MSPSSSPPPVFISREVQKARRFYLDLSPRKSHGLRVVCGGWELCAPGYHIRRDDFPYHVIEFVAGGQGRLKLGGRTHALGRGSIFAYGSRCPHGLETDPANCLSKYFVGFVGRRALALMKAHALAPGTCRLAAQPEEVQAAFEQVLADGAGPARSAAQITALQFQVLLLKMTFLDQSTRCQHQAYQTFVRCRTFLDDHFLDVTTAKQAASACHVDPAYASRLFARFGDSSFHHYLVRRRMAWAANLLDGGQMIVREAAEKLGMDAFHFSRVFKRVHGISPTSFLRRLESWSREV
jgi:AraC-like DNA-binding protein